MKKEAYTKRGFSLLELLMAITVLVLIVLMISLVFQQTQNAWSSGIRTASTDTTLRTVLGFLERDITHAIDATPYGQVNATNNIPPGAGFELMTLDGDATSSSNRMPQLVNYSLSVSASGSGQDLTRSVYPMTLAGTTWTVAGAPSIQSVVNGNTPLSVFKITFVSAPAGSVCTLPLRADIEAHLVTAAADQTFSVISGRSAGPDKTFGTSDDIMGRPDY